VTHIPSPGTEADLGVAVVIVNYRTPELTVEAMRSVVDEPSVEEVVVVDNDSGDDSVPVLRSTFADPRVRIVEAPSNLGFGQGVNLGVSHCAAPLVFVLNSDAVVSPGTVRLLAEALAVDRTLGVVAPAVFGPDGRTLQPAAYGRLPRPWAFLRIRSRPRRDDTAVGWVSGVAMLLRRRDFLAVGGFDPDFTMYFEDVDLCRRLPQAGLGVARIPEGAVLHRVGGSAHATLTTTQLFQRSKIAYLEKAGASSFQLRVARMLGCARLLWARVLP